MEGREEKSTEEMEETKKRKWRRSLTQEEMSEMLDGMIKGEIVKEEVMERVGREMRRLTTEIRYLKKEIEEKKT